MSYVAGERINKINYRLHNLTTSFSCECNLHVPTNFTIDNGQCRLPRRFWVSVANRETTPPFNVKKKEYFQQLLGK